jgi:hypothetical protein
MALLRFCRSIFIPTRRFDLIFDFGGMWTSFGESSLMIRMLEGIASRDLSFDGCALGPLFIFIDHKI